MSVKSELGQGLMYLLFMFESHIASFLSHSISNSAYQPLPIGSKHRSYLFVEGEYKLYHKNGL